MSDIDIDSFESQIVELTLGNVRHVKTAEGATYYHLPIGAPITKAYQEAAEAAHALKGNLPPKNALTSPAQHGAHAPGSDPTKYNSKTGIPTPKPLKLKVIKPTVQGNQHFSVGGSDYSAPQNSKLIKPTGNDNMLYVVEPNGKVHAFTAAGEIQIDPVLKDPLSKKLNGDLSNNPDYKEVPFSHESAPHEMHSLPVGQKLVDKKGKHQFTKQKDGNYKHAALGAIVSEKDLQSQYDKGDLLPHKDENAPVQDSFNNKTAVNFAEMSQSDFTAALDSYPVGQKLSYGESDAPLTLEKKSDGTWESSSTGAAITSESLYHLKANLHIGADKQESTNPLAPKDSPAVGKAPQDNWINTAAVGSSFDYKSEQGDTTTWSKTGPDEWSTTKPSGYVIKYDNADMIVAKDNGLNKGGTATVTKDVPAPPAADAGAGGDKTPRVPPVSAPEPTPRPGSGLEAGTGDYKHQVTDFGQISLSPEGTKVLVKNGDGTTNEFEHTLSGKWNNVADSTDTIGPMAMEAKVNNGDVYAGDAIAQAQQAEIQSELDKITPGDSIYVDSTGEKFTKDGKGDGLWLNEHNSIIKQDAIPVQSVEDIKPIQKQNGGTLPVEYHPAMAAWKQEDHGAYPGDYKYTHETSLKDITNAKPGDKILQGYAPDYEHDTLMNNLPHYETDSLWEKQTDGTWRDLMNPSSVLHSDLALQDIVTNSPFDYQPEQLYTNEGNSTLVNKDGISAVRDPASNLAAVVTPLPKGVPRGAQKINSLSEVQVGHNLHTVDSSGAVFTFYHNANNEWTNVGTGSVFPDSSVQKLSGETQYSAPPIDKLQPEAQVGQVITGDQISSLSPGTTFHMEGLSPSSGGSSFTMMPGGQILNQNGGTHTPIDWISYEISGVPGNTVKTPAVGDIHSSPESLDTLAPGTTINYVGIPVAKYDKLPSNHWENQNSGAVYNASDLFGKGYGDLQVASLPPAEGTPASVEQTASFKKGDPVLGSHLYDIPIGSTIETLKGLVLTKNSDHMWTDEEGQGHTTTQVQGYAANSGLQFVSGPKAETTPEPASVEPLADWELALLLEPVKEDIVNPANAGTHQLYTGGPSLTSQQVQSAIIGLQGHSGFQIKYGLKSLPEDHPLKNADTVQALTDQAKQDFPNSTPKQAVLSYLKAKLGISEGGPVSTDAPKIHFGSNSPKSSIQGFDGGDFTHEDIKSAISILENYNGKFFKSELNKQNNSLGTLDPTKIVGFDKDKLVTKQKFIDLLKEKLKNAPGVPKPEPTLASKFEYNKQDFADLQNGTVLKFIPTNAPEVLWEKIAGDEWISYSESGTTVTSSDDGFDVPHMWKNGQLSIHSMPAPSEAGNYTELQNLNAAMESLDKATADAVQLPITNSLSAPGQEMNSISDFTNYPVGGKVELASYIQEMDKTISSIFVKKDHNAWEMEGGTSGKFFTDAQMYESNVSKNGYESKVTAFSTPDTAPEYATAPTVVQELNNVPVVTEAVFDGAGVGQVFISKDKGYIYTKQQDGTFSGFDPATGTVQWASASALKHSAIAGALIYPPNDLQYNESGFLPGKYTSNGKAFMIVHADGKGVYINSKGTVTKLSANAVKKNHAAGISTYAGVPDNSPIPEPDKKAAVAKAKPKTADHIENGTYYAGLPSSPKSIIYHVEGDTVKAYKPASAPANADVWGNPFKVGGTPTAAWAELAGTGAMIKNKYDGQGSSYYATKYPTLVKQADGTWHNAATGEVATFPVGYHTSYYYKIAGHGYNAEPTAEKKTKLLTLLAQGNLVDEYGTSVVPAGYTGGMNFFGAPTTIPQLLAAQAELNAPEDLLSPGEILQKHGINFDPTLTTKYINANYSGEGDHTLQAMQDALATAVATVDTTPPESNAGQYFTYDSLGQANFPSSLVNMSVYSAAEKTAFIKEASNLIGGGSIIGQHLTSMTADQKGDWITYFKNGNFAALYNIEVAAAAKTGKPHASGFNHPGYSGNTDTNKMVWGPAVPGEISAAATLSGDWSSVSVSDWSMQEVDNYLIQAQMQNPTFLSANEKKNWVSYHKNNNKQQVDSLSVLAQSRKNSGELPKTEPLTWTDEITPAKIYDKLFDSTDFPLSWNNNQAEAYIKDNPQNAELQAIANKHAGNYYGQANAAQEYFQAQHDAFEAKKLIPVYTLDTSKTIPKSTHPTLPYKDQFGGEYWFKPAYDNKLGKYRSEAEHLGNLLGKLFGFKTANSQMLTLDGKYGQLQQDVGGVSDLMGHDYSALNATQIADIGSEHVLDHLLDNDDTHGSNAKLLPSGHIVGIDKGRAFKHYGAWNGLSANSGMNGNAQTIYSQLYDAIRSGKIDKATVDKAYLAIQKKANNMAKISSEKIKELLAEGMKNRDSYDISYKIDGKPVPNTYAGLEAAVLDRQSKLPEQIKEMWAKIYKDSGYGALPEPPVSPLGDHISGLDHAQLHEDLFVVNSHGKSTLVNGNHFLGGTVTMWNSHNTDGTQNMHGEAFLSPQSQESTLAWLTARAKNVSPSKSDPSGLGVHDIYGPSLVDAAKTINHHSDNGDYNQDKITAYIAAKELLKKDQEAWTPSLTSNSKDGQSYLFPSGQLIPMGQVDQYKLMLDYYDGLTPTLDKAMAEQTKTGMVVSAYQPISLASPPATYINSSAGQKLTKLSNDQWIHNDGTGKLHILTPSDQVVKDAIAGGNWTPVEETKSAGSSGAVVEYTTTHDTEGVMKDGKLTYTSNPMYNGVQGSEYSVTLPTGEKIWFRNESHTGTLKSQAGKLTFKIPNASSPEETKLSMQRIHDQLQEMGIDASPADLTTAELTYWREMFAVLANRKHKSGDNYDKTYTEMGKKVAELKTNEQNFLGALSNSMAPEEETQYWRSLWSKYFDESVVNSFIQEEKFLPYYEHGDLNNPEIETGKPQWLRHDVNVSDIANHSHFMASSSNANDKILALALSGIALSTEERIRFYGKYIAGMSSGDDQQNGAAHIVYTRLTKKADEYNFVYHPRVLARTRTFSFYTDHWGKPQLRKTESPSDPMHALNGFGSEYGGSMQSNNETDIPHSASILDDLEMVLFTNTTDRNAAIQAYKERGLDIVRGIPIEERFVMQGSSDANTALNKIRKTWKATP